MLVYQRVHGQSLKVYTKLIFSGDENTLGFNHPPKVGDDWIKHTCQDGDEWDISWKYHGDMAELTILMATSSVSFH